MTGPEAFATIVVIGEAVVGVAACRQRDAARRERDEARAERDALSSIVRMRRPRHEPYEPRPSAAPLADVRVGAPHVDEPYAVPRFDPVTGRDRAAFDGPAVRPKVVQQAQSGSADPNREDRRA